jgi:hypothetical protein
VRVRTSYADFVTDFEQLLNAINNDPRLADLKVKPLLEQQLADIKAINARQALHTAERQQATKEMHVALVKGRDIALQLRAEVKSRIDPRDEILVHFKVKPLRTRTRKAKSPAGEPVPEPTPEPTAAPAGAPAPAPQATGVKPETHTP